VDHLALLGHLDPVDLLDLLLLGHVLPLLAQDLLGHLALVALDLLLLKQQLN
jgi:hypothetical protein